jgi:NAD(P)-dependent dehydrogenase (short-subunit alcohol dehydrogenase family)
MRLDGKVVLISGAARGIGRETLELFTREGAIVISGDVIESKTPPPVPAKNVRLDVTSETSWKQVVADILAEHGRLDVLVNNAGILSYAPIDELALDEWNRVIAVNQTGVFLGMREVVPAMRRQKAGSIVNFSSIWGNVGVPGAAAYHATKGAVRNMTKNAAMTYVGDGIRVNSIHPGIIDSTMIVGQPPEITAAVVAATPMKRAGKPIEIAYGVLFLASDESSYMTGAELVIDGGSLAT